MSPCRTTTTPARWWSCRTWAGTRFCSGIPRPFSTSRCWRPPTSGWTRSRWNLTFGMTSPSTTARSSVPTTWCTPSTTLRPRTAASSPSAMSTGSRTSRSWGITRCASTCSSLFPPPWSIWPGRPRFSRRVSGPTLPMLAERRTLARSTPSTAEPAPTKSPRWYPASRFTSS